MIDRSKFHATSIFVIYQDIFQSEIELLQNYIIEVADQFENKVREVNIQNSIDPEDYQQDALDNEYFKNALDFPKILHNSILITLQTIFEKTLRWLVYRSNVVFKPIEVPPKKNRESDTKYYIRILSTVYDVDMTSQSQLLLQIDELRMIRNLFVHGGGNLFSEKDEQKRNNIKEIINRSDEKLLLNEQTGEIAIYSKQYLILFSQKISLVLQTIFSQLINKHTILVKENVKIQKS